MTRSLKPRLDRPAMGTAQRAARLTITREQLYDLVWNVPVRHAARQLGISNVYLARICRYLDVPKPGLGWWAKKYAGADSAHIPLPPERPLYPTSWAKGDPLDWITRVQRDTLHGKQSRGSETHPLIALTGDIFRKATPSDDGCVLITRATMALDMTISSSVLDTAIDFASELLTTLACRGHSLAVTADHSFARPDIDRYDVPDDRRSRDPRRLSIPDWTPRYPSIASIGGRYVGLAILETVHLVEMQYVGFGSFLPVALIDKDESLRPVGITWKTWRKVPTGRLRLVAYSVKSKTPWQTAWDPPTSKSRVPDIKKAISELEQPSRLQSETADRPLHVPPQLRPPTGITQQ
ncbi:hypothetical protein [Rhizobium skierniewicense]|uniref:hypothetical protein n=1 Tax=Rhizobium skierniewicense TaxID=984260 RepID=UPI0015744F7D|nr:hypothetical protein [Rhizobium skierniewicense]NTF35021.1 hypothetical protein [Rhizobium skierniewicense]